MVIFYISYQYYIQHNHQIINYVKDSFSASNITEAPIHPDETSIYTLHSFKHYNERSYNKGVLCYNRYVSYLKKLEKKKYNQNHCIEKAYMYLKRAMNYFQQLTIPSNETKRINYLDKKNDSYQDMITISNKIKDIYSYNLLILKDYCKKNNISTDLHIYSGFSDVDSPDPYNMESIHEFY